MRALAAVIFSCVVLGQESTPRGLVVGHLIQSEGTADSGEVAFRLEDHRVYRCAFDRRTLFERDQKQVAVAEIDRTDRVELVLDHVGVPARCYLRIARVVAPSLPKPVIARTRIRPYRMVTEHIAPRGNLTFAGVVRRVLPDGILLRTRTGGDKTIRVRPDTRYVEAGSAVEAAALQVNTTVFIRAGKNLDNEIEAFQVMWGEILPRP